jgi:signal transduction histidine kinase
MLLVGGLAAAVTVLAAVVAPARIERVLVDDALRADAVASAESLQFDLSFVELLGVSGLFDEAVGGAVGRLVGGLEPSGAARELRARHPDRDVVVAVARDLAVVVDASGGATIVRRLPADGPVVALDELAQLSTELDAAGGLVLPELFGDLPGDVPGDVPWLDDALLGDESPVDADELRLPSRDPGDLAYGVREVAGSSYLVATPIDSVRRSVDRVRTVLWLAVPVVTVVAAGAAWLLAGRALRPVRAITERAASIHGAGALDQRVPVPATGDEVATLATTVNEMLDRLERDDARRRRFVSDASHELRSPVAVMRTTAEVALARPQEADAAALAGTVVAETSRMSAVIDDLLALARHDEGLAPPGLPVDLDDVVLAEVARARRVPVGATGVSAGRVRGRRDELARMVAHLLDNAARHAATRVEVGLAVERSGDAHVAVLTVDDDGPGVPPDRRGDVFERFVRLDDARSRDAGGAGLGLAVVAATARGSGGDVAVTDSPLGGARFVVRIPSAD